LKRIRIDLVNQYGTDQVYLEETKLEGVKKALEKIARDVERLQSKRKTPSYQYIGACELRQPYPTIHTLTASAYYLGPNSSGLSLSAYKGQEFRFPYYSPLELAEAIGQAIDNLKQH
jgi:hypothetical protein